MTSIYKGVKVFTKNMITLVITKLCLEKWNSELLKSKSKQVSLVMRVSSL